MVPVYRRGIPYSCAWTRQPTMRVQHKKAQNAGGVLYNQRQNHLHHHRLPPVQAPHRPRHQTNYRTKKSPMTSNYQRKSPNPKPIMQIIPTMISIIRSGKIMHTPDLRTRSAPSTNGDGISAWIARVLDLNLEECLLEMGG